MSTSVTAIRGRFMMSEDVWIGISITRRCIMSFGRWRVLGLSEGLDRGVDELGVCWPEDVRFGGRYSNSVSYFEMLNLEVGSGTKVQSWLFYGCFVGFFSLICRNEFPFFLIGSLMGWSFFRCTSKFEVQIWSGMDMKDRAFWIPPRREEPCWFRMCGLIQKSHHIFSPHSLEFGGLLTSSGVTIRLHCGPLETPESLHERATRRWCQGLHLHNYTRFQPHLKIMILFLDHRAIKRLGTMA